MNEPQWPRRPLPPLAPVRQVLADDRLADPRADVRDRLLAFGLADHISDGDRIAVTAGSRGIGGFVELLAGVVDAIRHCGARAVIIPAMGSHGGATADGQTEILRRLGVDESSVGAPVEATMQTVELGTASNGAVVHLDRIASQCDGIIVLGRVKTHPESASGLASGLLKMVTIGLGKQAGAEEAHTHGLWKSVNAVPQVLLQKARVLCGVAVVENALRHPMRIEVVEPTADAFLDADRRLLEVARAHLPRIPFEALDLLVVDEMGKNISGAGMDPNVVGHWRIAGGEHTPDFHRVVVLSLTPESLGNGIGVGMADFITRRFVDAYDDRVTWMNVLTATEPGSNPREASLPLALETDRDAMEVALFSALAGGSPRVCRIRNTAALEEIRVSPALLDQTRQNPRLEVLSEPEPITFDERGNLR